ncbi:MAG: twin-arginine translocase TatA/TatE family subunit [Planctomycetota bacterium]|nr:twin-arginine translocase TatA/TatE family subunit [Planctomycetota bacterium]
MIDVSTPQIALIPGISGYEWIILLVLGLLIFGNRLPALGKSLGKTIVEFKRGLKDVEGDIENEANQPQAPANQNRPQQGQIGHQHSGGGEVPQQQGQGQGATTQPGDHTGA